MDYTQALYHSPAGRAVNTDLRSQSGTTGGVPVSRIGENGDSGDGMNANGSGASVNGAQRQKRKINRQSFSKKRSWVWNWFVQDHGDIDVAVCDHCGKTVRRLPSDKGSPKKLAEHLKTHKINRDTEHSGRVELAPSITNGAMENNIRAVATNTPTPHHNKKNDNTARMGGQSRNDEYSHLPRELLAEFDLSPYSAIKFHKDIMKFLTDNKLPISAVKSDSFRQLVFTLRPNSIQDLNELNSIYTSLVEVIKVNNSSNQASSESNNDENNRSGTKTPVAAAAAAVQLNQMYQGTHPHAG